MEGFGSSSTPLKEQGPPGSKRAPKGAQMKNKAAAAIQITAEQIMREARDRQVPDTVVKPKQHIMDADELKAEQVRIRTEFENKTRRNPHNFTNWKNYAKFEATQKDFVRARSVWERALHVDHHNPSLWMAYAEMEMSSGYLNFARNVLHRATTQMPRVDSLWLKWAHMEETKGDILTARTVYQKWIGTKPSASAWKQAADFEVRYQEIENARRIMEEFVKAYNIPTAWLQFAKFERKHGDKLKARDVFERAIQALDDAAGDEIEEGQEKPEVTMDLLLEFAKFEQEEKETERARAIFKYAADKFPRTQAEQKYLSFEKQYGDVAAIEDAVLQRKRFSYERELQSNSYNYDAWFDYIRMEENVERQDKATHKRIREIYERAIANVPRIEQKNYWSRYIYLWIMYAVFTELVEEDLERTQKIYEACLKAIPHGSFTFAKVWINYAHFELRRGNLDNVRKIFGTALGKHPTAKLFRAYLELEMQLGELSRVRKLYTKWIQNNPSDTQVWIRYATLEESLQEPKRARGIYELALRREEELDQREILWKNFIDFEVKQQQYDRARALYTDLVNKSGHVKVYLAFAMFEARVAKDANRARGVFEDAYNHLSGDEESRTTLLTNWNHFEVEQLKDNGESRQHLDRVVSLMNPQENKAKKLSGLMAAAQARKKQKTGEE